MIWSKIRLENWIGISFLVFLIASCATLPSDVVSSRSRPIKELKKIAQAAPNQEINEKLLRSKMNTFRAAIQSKKDHLSRSEWRLHDDLLQKYIELKTESSNKFSIPAHSIVTKRLLSFCLNSSRAIPETNEVYKWAKGQTEIPYLTDILKGYSKNKNWSQEDVQNLIWNLQNETKWEAYPDRLKMILKSIDPKVELKLPSELKDEAKDVVSTLILDHVPGASGVQKTLELVKGKYYEYEDIKRSISKLKSNEILPPDDEAYEIPHTPIYASTKSDGYSDQTVTFYNPTDHDANIELSDYHLQPIRQDVQRIAMAAPEARQSHASLLADLESLLFGDMLRLGVGFTPGLNDIADIYEFLLSRDFVSGRTLTTGERLLSGLGLIAGSGAGYRYVERAIFAPAKYVGDFERGYSRIANKEIALSTIDRRAFSQVLNDTQTTVDGIKKSPTLNRIFENQSFKKIDFYVRPNGDVIPARAYRYIPSDAPYREELIHIGRIPENPKGTYLSFNKYDQPDMARDGLQLYAKNDAGIRVEFDTKQILEDIRIPRGKFNTADYLEPLTKDYPEFGLGRGTQAVTNRSIQASRIVDLMSGKIVYEAK